MLVSGTPRTPRLALVRWLHSPGFAGMGLVACPKDWETLARDTVNK